MDRRKVAEDPDQTFVGPAVSRWLELRVTVTVLRSNGLWSLRRWPLELR
jgi:hypothetical protein